MVPLCVQLYLNERYQQLNPKYFEPPRNDRFSKPRGGLWTSSYIDREHGSEWMDWCIGEDFRSARQHSWLLEPMPDARVYEIDTLHDLKALLRKHHYDAPWNGLTLGYGLESRMLDFEAIAKRYDAIHLTSEGQWRTKLSTPNLYGWDCESTLWLKWKFRKADYIGEIEYTRWWLKEEAPA